MSQTPFGEIKLLILTNRQKVTEAISEFKIKYPRISFNIKHQGLINQTNINEYDIIVSDGNISSEHFEQKLWLTEEILLAVPGDNPLSDKNSVSAKDIKDEKFICMPAGSCLRQYSDNFFLQNGINPEIIIECDEPQYIRKYLKMGFGVTFFPAVSWREQITDDIKLLRINEGLYRKSYIYTNKAASNAVRLLAEMLETK